MINCNICGAATATMEVTEQMLGLNESFVYHQCIKCGHTHLDELPKNMQKYYAPQEYYSFKNESTYLRNALNKYMRFLKKILLKLTVKKSFLFSSALQSLLSIKGINENTSILDYGCGAGQFVEELNGMGFNKARGFDPYLPIIKTNQNVTVLSNNLKSLQSNCWDIITLNHVFEHLENPIQILQDLNKLLCSKGKLLLRFPIIDSFAFEKYRENWVQFDAPRHINLFTRKSIQLAVEKAGDFKIISMYDDSFHFQFTGSDLYMSNLSLSPKDNNRLKRLLSLKTYQYHFLAKKLNRQNRGDQMVIILEQL